jgi:hypothetical protein
MNDPDPTNPNIYDHHDRQFAIEFLQDALKDGPQPMATLLKEARKLAISERTLKRAKAHLAIQSEQIGHTWQWILPPPT